MRLLHAMLVAFALLTLGTGARAAVPLCSDDGRTMMAPPAPRPGPSRGIEAPDDCEWLRALVGHSKPKQNPRNPIELGDAPPRAVPIRALFPAAPIVGRLEVTIDFGRVRPAITDDVFRPPRRS